MMMIVEHTEEKLVTEAKTDVKNSEWLKKFLLANEKSNLRREETSEKRRWCWNYILQKKH